MTGTKRFIITTPNDDDVVFYCNVWSKEIIDLANQKGFKVTQLDGEKATCAILEGYLNGQNARFVMFNGHGGRNEITGTAKATLVKSGENEEILKGTIVYARSCYTLDGLGASACRAGCESYVGYRLPFMFVSDPNEGARPLHDELAKPCFVTSNIIPMTLLKGNSISDSVQKAKTEMRKMLEYWETRTDLVEAPIVAACLYWNQSGLGFEGDSEARL